MTVKAKKAKKKSFPKTFLLGLTNFELVGKIMKSKYCRRIQDGGCSEITTSFFTQFSKLKTSKEIS